MQWEVWINGKFSGIVETNYAWAKVWWAKRTARTGKHIKLKERV